MLLGAIPFFPIEKVKALPRDMDDGKLFECALEAKASFIASHDKDVLVVKKFRGIAICRPEELLALL